MVLSTTFSTGSSVRVVHFSFAELRFGNIDLPTATKECRVPNIKYFQKELGESSVYKFSTY